MSSQVEIFSDVCPPRAVVMDLGALEREPLGVLRGLRDEFRGKIEGAADWGEDLELIREMLDRADCGDFRGDFHGWREEARRRHRRLYNLTCDYRLVVMAIQNVERRECGKGGGA